MSIFVTPNPISVLASAPSTPASLVIQTAADGDYAIVEAAVVVKKASGKKEWAWDNVRGFNGNYLGRRNTAVRTGDNTWTIQLLRDGGWDENSSILTYAVDDHGEVWPGLTSGSHAGTVSTSATPSAGSLIEETTVLSVTINPTASIGGGTLAWMFAILSFPGANTRELVWDSIDGFNPGAPYTNASNTATFHAASPPHWGSETLTLLRDGGWPGSPTLDFFLANVDGTISAIGP